MSLVRLSEIQLPTEEKFLSLGIHGLDQCLAESDEAVPGVPEGTSILLSGSPGGGKSSLTMYAVDAAGPATEDEGAGLILSGEERPVRARKRWDRLGLGKKGADPFIHDLGDAEDALQVIREIKPRIVVVDSVQTLSLGGKRKYDQQLEAVELIAGQVCSAGGIVIFVCHVSKNGKDHAGAMGLAHIVDIHLHVSVNAKKQERVLEVRKNRHGRAGFQVPMYIGQSSVTVGTPAPITGDGSLNGARTQLDTARNTAIEFLLKGEKLSGYDFDKCDPVVNGGVWRAGLEMACKHLAREENGGYEIMSGKIGGRKTFWLANPPGSDVPVDVKPIKPVYVDSIEVINKTVDEVIESNSDVGGAGGEQYPMIELD